MSTVAAIFAVLLVTASLACDSTTQGAKPGDASAADGASPDPVCAAYCDHAVAACAVKVDACQGACQTFVSGKCAAQWRAVYQCGKDTMLTCDASGAHPFGCIGELARAGDCFLPTDAASGQ